MVAARRSAEVTGALADGKRKAGPAVSGSPHALLALQRDAGNAAVGALMAAKQKQPDQAALGHIDAALKEVRGSEPEIDTVEKGLKAAQSAGVPVTLEGPKPPASALAVTTTGFGPNAVQPKKPVPPAKPVPAKSKLGTAAARPAAKAGGASAKPAAAPVVPAVAAADPAFMQVTEKVKGFAAAKRAHPPAAAKAKEAQDAAQAPADDLAGQAKASKVDSMDAQQAGSFDKQAFIAAVKTAIEAKSPKTLQEGTSPQGKADGVASEVKGMVSQGKEGQAKDIEAATDAAPDQSKAVPKPVTPMAQENPGAAPAIPAAGAAPKPAPPSQTDLTAGKQQVAQEQSDVTDEQMRQSNEPQFQQALDAKQTAAAHADTAPAQVRAQEQQVIGQAKAEAGAVTAGGVAGMQGAKGAALAKLVADKGKTKTKDEAKRAEVTTRIQGIFAATETEVKKILGAIDPKVETEFAKGEAAARQAFESFVAAKVNAYKQDRYSGWLGGYRWIKDKVLSVPDKVNEFYTAGRELYLKQMDGVISRVADIVGNDLSLAKQKIATGKAEIAAFVKTLSPDLQKVGADASAEINDRFEQLESDVTDKQNAVVDTLATKYTEARQAVDERIEALQAENKGFVDAAVDAVKGVVNTIRELAAMLRDVLSRAAAVVGDIVKKPVEFLGNLIAGVKGGILKFKDNILEHLRKGLMGWLFGALADAGIELPEKFDVRGIIKLLASIFGLTWSNIRSRLVRQIGEKAMAAAEKGVEIFQVLTTQGVSGLWQMLMEKLSDIKETILAQVKDFVITKIITAGITWLIGLLNPAAAFIKACKLIYDVVMFFVTNGSRIMKFVNTVIDSVADIVRGNVGGVVDKINDVLGQMVPIIIGFLASAIGLGGIGAKIRSIIETLQKPVNKALDWVIKKGLTLAGPIIKRLKNVSGKVKAKVAAGKAWVKGKVDKGRQWVKSKVYGGDDSQEGRKKRQDAALRAGVAAANRFAGRPVGGAALKPLLGAIRVRYGVEVLEPVPRGHHWGVHASLQRTRDPLSQFDLTWDVDDPEARTSRLDDPVHQAGILEASHLFAALPNIEAKQNVASDGTGAPVLSGWGKGEIAATEAVRRESLDAGHEPAGHVFDPKDSPGLYQCSHSELKLLAAGAVTAASAKPMCDECIKAAAKLARKSRVARYVGDPGGVHVFLEDGAHKPVRHPSGAITQGPKKK
ncbi:hypothetical protein SK803_43775 [Lentzea sp. BCCO 10_0856]|uniref:YwqJ-like deaminase n=1 Tax=Lentzea miocenica TaxID=3095431 RepID=A0ABU4TG41_9PSEU|nr:hypothetical protein [Lentzea sp. BCCO 10_0856]MDX8037155.1 hypothetical protein [Lentzea sp. BCCO 10_0856]